MTMHVVGLRFMLHFVEMATHVVGRRITLRFAERLDGSLER
jgi:hypothetical protein